MSNVTDRHREAFEKALNVANEAYRAAYGYKEENYGHAREVGIAAGVEVIAAYFPDWMPIELAEK